jgi:putative DNA primase/helicase
MINYTDTKISFYSSIFKTDEQKTISIAEAFELITSEKLQNLVEQIRQEKNKDQRNKLKMQLLPCVTWQGTFTARSIKGFAKSSGLACIDFDDYEKGLSIKNNLMGDKYVLSCFLSPSGGVKAIVKIPEIKNDAEYKNVYQELLKYFQQYSPNTDEQNKDVSRACWLSYDPELYLNQESSIFTTNHKETQLVPENFNETKFDFQAVLSGASQGSRNTSLHKYACRLRAKGLTKSEVQKLCILVNQEFSPPLSEQEVLNCVEGAWRYSDENILQTSGNLKETVTKFLFSQKHHKDLRKATEMIVLSFLNNNKVYTTRDDEHCEMWIYRDGIYIPQAKTYIHEFCRQILCENFTQSIANEVIVKIESDTYIAQEEFFQRENIEEIAVLNGILNLKTNFLMPFTPEKKFFNKIPVIFDETKVCDNILQHLKNVLKSSEDLPVIQELFGYLLYCDYKIEKAFMFTGSGRNGKGKTVELMKRFIGADNCANISLQQMEQDNFAIGELFNKMANLSPDINSEALKNTGYFKSLTGHDLQSAARKFKTRVNFVNYAKMIFCANELPRTSDLNLAFFNRWILLDFPYTFLSQKEIDCLTEEEKENVKLADPQIIEKISVPEELSGLLNWALKGLQRLLSKGDFSYSQSTQEVKNNWIRKSNNLAAFLMDFVIEDYESEINKSEFRHEYSEYCKKHKIKPVSDRVIRDVLTTEYGVSEIRHMNQTGTHQIWFWKGIMMKVDNDENLFK